MDPNITYNLNAKYKDGTLNELYKRVVTKSVVIDSRFRDNYNNNSSSSFIASLSTPINEIMEMEVTQLEIPKAWYAVSNSLGNNFFHVDASCITIPDGNYNASRMQSAINNILSTDKTIEIDVDPDCESGTNRTVFKGANTIYFNKYKGDSTGNGSDIDPTPLPLKLGWMLGFRQGEYTVSNNVLLSEGLFDAYGPRYLYLAIEDYNHNQLNETFIPLNNSLVNKNIIARYAVSNNSDTPNGSGNTFFNKLVSFTRQYTGPVNINKLKIQVLDEYGRIINMNNMDYSVVLTFKGIYIR
jgi:hypothetical protein